MVEKTESRGGGYDLATERDQKKKKAMGTETRQSLGAQAVSRSPGANPEAPSSLGQLMSPTVNAQPSQLDPNDETYNRQVEKNRTFLSSPEVRAQLLQFGVSLMAGNNPGEALGKAMSLPARARSADAKLQKEQRESERADIKLQMELERFGMDKAKISEEISQKENRKALFASLKVMSDDKLMQVASELAAEGDDEGAKLALSMMKSMRDPQTEGLISQYRLAVEQGFQGDIIAFKNATDNLSVMETIRQKLAQGITLDPGEEQVYNDAISADLLTRMMSGDPDFAERVKTILGAGGAPVGSPTTPAPPAKTEGVSGNVPFKVVPN